MTRAGLFEVITRADLFDIFATACESDANERSR